MRRQILDAAHEVLARDGARGLSLRAVAKEVGVTPMALYRHFENKDDLIDALMLDGISAWERRLRALPAAAPVARMEGAFAAFLDFALTEPSKFEAAFLLDAPGARRYPDGFADGASASADLLLKDVAAAARGGAIAGASAREIAVTLWAMAQGLVSLYRAGRFGGGEKAFRMFYRRAMRRCLDSFATRCAG